MNLSIEDGLLKIDLSRVEKVLSVHGSFRTPLEQVESVSTEVPRQSWRDHRVPGTFLPWVVKAGTYLTERGREFWYVTRNRGFLTIELKNGSYKRIVLGLNDNQHWADQIESSVRSFQMGSA